MKYNFSGANMVFDFSALKQKAVEMLSKYGAVEVVYEDEDSLFYRQPASDERAELIERLRELFQENFDDYLIVGQAMLGKKIQAILPEVIAALEEKS